LKVVTSLSVKGGVGKTTLSVNTANELAERVSGSEKVLVIDLDAQAGATVYVLGHERQENLEKEGKTAYGLLRGALRAKEAALDPEKFVVKAGGEWSSRLYLLPGDSRIVAIEREAIAEAAAGGFGWISLLRQLLPKLSESGFSHVFVDPPAAFGVLARMALAAAALSLLAVYAAAAVAGWAAYEAASRHLLPALSLPIALAAFALVYAIVARVVWTSAG